MFDLSKKLRDDQLCSKSKLYKETHQFPYLSAKIKTMNLKEFQVLPLKICLG